MLGSSLRRESLEHINPLAFGMIVGFPSGDFVSLYPAAGSDGHTGLVALSGG
jgi:hypothetical protein